MGRIASLGLAAALFLFPTGCSLGPDWAAIQQQAQQIHATCESRRQSGELRTVLATEQCANSQIRNLYAANGFPDMDVLDAYLARREAIAAAEDRGTISIEEARAQYAEAQVQENTALQQRAGSRAAFAYWSAPLFCNRVGPSMMTCY